MDYKFPCQAVETNASITHILKEKTNKVILLTFNLNLKLRFDCWPENSFPLCPVHDCFLDHVFVDGSHNACSHWFLSMQRLFFMIDSYLFFIQCPLRGWTSQESNIDFQPYPLHTEISQDSQFFLNDFMHWR